MTETSIKTDNKETIHNACIQLIVMLNYDTRDLAETLGIAYNTAFKKQRKVQEMNLNKKDLIKLMDCYDKKEQFNIIKRREILDLMYALKIK